MIAKAVSTSGPMLKAVHHHEDDERLFQRRRCKLFHPTRSTTTRALGIDVAIPTKHQTKSRAWGQVSIGRLIYGLNQRSIIRRIKMDQSKSDRRARVRRPIVLIRHQTFPQRTAEGEEGNSGKKGKKDKRLNKRQNNKKTTMALGEIQIFGLNRGRFDNAVDDGRVGDK